MKNILIVFGTRPEAIKMCPVVNALKKEKEFNIKVCSTGQHKEMLRGVLDIFNVKVDYDLNIMRPMQTLSYITEKILRGISEILSEESFDLILVHGDTTTAFAAALAGFYNKLAIGHVEAGLRTNDICSPFPEEFNRRSIDMISNIYFAPTTDAKNNLIKEGVEDEKIFVTGNTAIDALNTTVTDDYFHEEIEWCRGKRMLLLTCHRRENVGEPMREIFSALRRVCKEYDDVRIIYPVHMNPTVREIASKVFEDCQNVHLIRPLNVIDFHNFIKECYMVLTDSGGIQEEAPALNKPVLVVRNTTERPEGVKAGTLKLVGTEEEKIYKEIIRLLNDKDMYQDMCDAVNPYGDGHASEYIVEILKNLNCEKGKEKNDRY